MVKTNIKTHKTKYFMTVSLAQSFVIHFVEAKLDQKLIFVEVQKGRFGKLLYYCQSLLKANVNNFLNLEWIYIILKYFHTPYFLM